MFSPISTLYTYFPLQFIICTIIDLSIMALGVFLAVRLYKKGTFRKSQSIACIVLFVWSAVVLFMTVLGRRYHPHYSGNHNFELFSSYRAIFVERNKTLLISVLQNILMFVPIGITLPIVLKNKHRLILSLLICFFLSLLIETCQLLLKSGFFELDDLFNNTLGGLIGIIVCLICSSLYKKDHDTHRKEDILAAKNDR